MSPRGLWGERVNRAYRQKERLTSAKEEAPKTTTGNGEGGVMTSRTGEDLRAGLSRREKKQSPKLKQGSEKVIGRKGTSTASSY